MKNSVEKFLELLFLMTGREELLEKKPDEFQLKGINALYPFLEEAAKKGLSNEAKGDLLNRILLTFGIKPFSPEFFDIVFTDVDFSEIE